MCKTRSMMRAKKYDDAYKRNTMRSWSDLSHDVLSLVMMKLEVVDILEFNRVCKSWRSLAVSNRNKLIVSRAPMAISIYLNAANEKECYLNDFEGRKFKTIIPHSSDRTYIGVTCGYLILYGQKSKDFWLVNPITSHELHFPGFPFHDRYVNGYFKAILVFSPSISKWVLVVFSGYFYDQIVWFSIAGKGEWTSVSTTFCIRDLHAFKGKIYALHFWNRLSEVILYPTPKVTLLEIKNFPNPDFEYPVLASAGENLCVMELFSKSAYKIIVNFSKVEWVSLKKIRDEFALFFSKSKQGGFDISDLGSQYMRYADGDKGPKRKIFYADMWYFFHDCFNVNLLNE